MQFVLRLLRRIRVLVRSHVEVTVYFAAVVMAMVIGPLVGIEMLGTMVAFFGAFVVWLIGPFRDDPF